jgi:hypothetical protein
MYQRRTSPTQDSRVNVVMHRVTVETVRPRDDGDRFATGEGAHRLLHDRIGHHCVCSESCPLGRSRCVLRCDPVQSAIHRPGPAVGVGNLRWSLTEAFQTIIDRLCVRWNDDECAAESERRRACDVSRWVLHPSQNRQRSIDRDIVVPERRVRVPGAPRGEHEWCLTRGKALILKKHGA